MLKDNKDIQKLIDELSSFCEDNKIGFSYYRDIVSDLYSFRFRKEDRCIRIAISEIDLRKNPYISKSISNEIRKLFDSVVFCKSYKLP